MHIHTTENTLKKFIPLEILPNEAGGNAGALNDYHQARKKDLEDYRDWFAQDEANSRVKESLRPGKAKNVTDIFGVEGSFKKLDID